MQHKHRAPRDRYIFMSSRHTSAKEITEQMSQSTITWRMIRSFEKAQIFDNKLEAYKRISCSRVRFSVITELIALGTESLHQIVYTFGKQKKVMCKYFYVQFFNNRNATRLSWKAFNVKILQTANCMINYLFRIFNYRKKRFDSLKKEYPANFLPFYRDF